VPPLMQTEKTTLAVVAATLLLVGGIWWGGHPSDLPQFARNALTSSPHGTIVDQAVADVEHDYFHPLNANKLANGAIAGVVASLKDPYATYYTPQEFSDFGKPPPAQHVSGVGIDVDVEHTGLLVQGVLPGSPAAHAGIKPGETIVAANGKSFVGRSAAYSTGLIRGKPGTTVTLLIKNGTHQLAVPVKRASLLEPMPIVTGAIKVVNGVKVAVIELPTFDIEGIHGDVASTLEGLLHQGATAVVLDLRDNPGGLVTEAQLVASLFLRRGVIVTTRGRSQPTVTLRATGDPIAPTLPLAVLVNGDTASAAEIVSGALQADHRATIVGTHTYGKGVYQEIRQLPNGGALDITVGEYFLPNGKNLGAGGLKRGAGVQPNVVVSAPVTASSDPALAAALRIVAARAH
jgi:carboxyl-terminal processing protease